MTSMMVKYPHIDGVFTINDPTATGANIAADRAEREEFFIVSVDGSPLAVDMLGDPNTRFAATVAQNPRRMAELAKARHAAALRAASTHLPTGEFARIALATTWLREFGLTTMVIER